MKHPSWKWLIRNWLCNHNLHWPIRWSENAHPYVPDGYYGPQPPEPDWCCQFCGKIRLPYRSWWWDLKVWYLLKRGKL